jgi:lysophospholipase L1-like esterase
MNIEDRRRESSAVQGTSKTRSDRSRTARYYCLLTSSAVLLLTPCLAPASRELTPTQTTDLKSSDPLQSDDLASHRTHRQKQGNSSGTALIRSAAAEPHPPGPTPYPKNEHDWPGVGVIRVFDWMVPNRQYFWSQRKASQGSVVFVGDSLIGGWKTLKEDFAPLRVANVGVGGDVSRGVLFRLQEDVINLNPRAVVILVGTNDLSANEDLSLFTSNMVSILKALRNHNRSLPIVLCNLPPHDSDTYFTSAKVADLNARLRSLTEPDPKLVLLDLNKVLARLDGSPDPENFGPDHVHLSWTGYRKFHAALVRIFRTLNLT